MKKTVLITSVFCLAVTTHAQSTCETRVDAHQKASTSQRVEYCLYPQNDASGLHNPGLVFSGVSSPDLTEPQREQTRPTARNNDFKPEEVGLSQSFVPTRTFPKVTDGRVSEQEKMAKRKALEEGRQAALETIAQNPCELPEEVFEEKAVLEQKNKVVETAAGIRARNRKPGREMIWKEEENNEATPAMVPTPQTPLGGSEFNEELSATTDVAAPATYDPYTPQEIPVGTASYSPAGPQEIPVGTASYSPAESQEIPVGTASYAPSATEEIPVGTSSYAPAQ